MQTYLVDKSCWGMNNTKYNLIRLIVMHTNQVIEKMLSCTFFEVVSFIPFWIFSLSRGNILQLLSPEFSIDMGENRIFFYNAGFKSYNITRRYSDSEEWFYWIEHSRYLMRRVTININVMKWLVFVFNAATEEKRKTIKRWNIKDHF